jgi:hypothetical protein
VIPCATVEKSTHTDQSVHSDQNLQNDTTTYSFNTYIATMPPLDGAPGRAPAPGINPSTPPSPTPVSRQPTVNPATTSTTTSTDDEPSYDRDQFRAYGTPHIYKRGKEQERELEDEDVVMKRYEDYIIGKAEKYERIGICDRDLWMLFHANFRHFKKVEFDFDMAAALKLRSVLRSQGVFVDASTDPDEDDVAGALMAAVRAYRPWTEAEARAAFKENGFHFRSKKVMRFFKRDLDQIAKGYSENATFNTSMDESDYGSPATVIRKATPRPHPPTPFQPAGIQHGLSSIELDALYSTSDARSGDKGKGTVQQRIEENWPKDPRERREATERTQIPLRQPNLPPPQHDNQDARHNWQGMDRQNVPTDNTDEPVGKTEHADAQKPPEGRDYFSRQPPDPQQNVHGNAQNLPQNNAQTNPFRTSDRKNDDDHGFRGFPPADQRTSAAPIQVDIDRNRSNMARNYKTNMKYSGRKDCFNQRLEIFYDQCDSAGIPPEGFRRAFTIMLTGDALDYYYNNSLRHITSFEDICTKIRANFEGEEYKREMLTLWSTISLQDRMKEDPSTTTIQHFEGMYKQLKDIQMRLPEHVRGRNEEDKDALLHNRILTACRDVAACRAACFNPPRTTEGLASSLRNSIFMNDKESRGTISALQSTTTSDVLFTERRIYDNRNHAGNRHQSSNKDRSRSKICFVCKKEGCWSTNHSEAERKAAAEEYKKQFKEKSKNDRRQYRQHMTELEGEAPDSCSEDDSSDEDEVYLTAEKEASPGDNSFDQNFSEVFLTSLGAIDGKVAIEAFLKRSLMHAITGETGEICDTAVIEKSRNSRYDDKKFQGIMIDTGAADKSTVGYGQCKAYMRLAKITMDTSTAGQAKFKFGIGIAFSKGTIDVEMPFGTVRFHVVDTDTPFLMSLADMDRLKIYLNNVTNTLVSTTGAAPLQVARKYGHTFLIWRVSAQAFVEDSIYTTECYLTDVELRRLHRRFGHPSVQRLHDILDRSGHDDVSKKSIEELTKFCEHCQKHGSSPGRFKFKLRDEVNFNHSIIVDIMYIDNKPILHIVDEGTRFQAARWLNNISAKHVWDTLRQCWIDAYLGPPDFIIHDAGTNFVSREFNQQATAMAIHAKSVPVEAHWSIGIVERYHAVLRRAYKIMQDELADSGLDREMMLQMAVKAVNDTAGPDGIVPTLLVFGAYPRMTELDAPSPTIAQRSAAIRRATAEIAKLRATRQVADALNQRNGPSTAHLHDLELGAEVLVWREGNNNKGSWDGPFQFQGIDGEDCKVLLTSGITTFRSTSVKRFNNDDNNEEDEDEAESDSEHSDNEPDPVQPSADLADEPRRGLRSATSGKERVKWTRSGTRAHITFDMNDHEDKDEQEPLFEMDEAYIQSTAEVYHLEDFTESRQKEIKGLLDRGVFKIIDKKDVPKGTRIYKARYVDEVKNKGTAKAFKKSRLVVQAYNDQEKKTILTQSPTIQRVSQRIILALTAILGSIDKVVLYIRDIQQAYVQSQTRLARLFIIVAPKEMGLPEGTLLQVMLPLYGIPESGNHWFGTYHKHHKEKLQCSTSAHDPCLLHTNTNGFGCVGLQVDDTLILADAKFAEQEELQLKQAGFIAKDREMLTEKTPLKFNGASISLVDGKVHLTQESQCKGLQTITTTKADITSSRGKITKEASPAEQYVSQRAKGAYVATMCQPEAAFDLSYAAQSLDHSEEDIKALNKRLQWQIDNADRGITFVPLDKESLKLVVFTDASFANNKDFTSQIGYIITLADKDNNANIIHWSSTKCKRVTRSILASELYGMASGFDMAVAVKTTFEGILDMKIPLVICTDSKSLYECMIKLGTTQEKRLMVDIMALRESYERREIAEIKWIEGDTNPADAMTKGKPCKALADLIDTNRLQMDVVGWVERD